MNYLKLINLTFFLLLLIFGCKKDPVVPEVIPVVVDEVLDENAPVIVSLSSTSNVGIGDSISIECQAFDLGGLASIHYRIESPNANYNFIQSDSFLVSGSSYLLKENITIPKTASVGQATLTFYAKDSVGNKSEDYSRDFNLIDRIGLTVTEYVDSVAFDDSLEISIYRNDNNIVDSFSVYNITQSSMVFSLKEYGGFTKMFAFIGVGESLYNGKTFDLTNGITTIYYTLKDIGVTSMFSDVHSFRLGFQEYDAYNPDFEFTGSIWSPTYSDNQLSGTGLPIKK